MLFFGFIPLADWCIGIAIGKKYMLGFIINIVFVFISYLGLREGLQWKAHNCQGQ